MPWALPLVDWNEASYVPPQAFSNPPFDKGVGP